MTRRLDFVEDAARGFYPVAELCARYGISRRVGYQKARYDAGGPDALGDRRRVAVTCPHRVPDDVAARLAGRERMHRTLKAEATTPPRANAAAQQRVFDRFRREYNEERPHEALANATPAEYYTAPPRPYPRRPLDPEYPGHYQMRYASRNGGGRWHNAWVKVSYPRRPQPQQAAPPPTAPCSPRSRSTAFPMLPVCTLPSPNGALKPSGTPGSRCAPAWPTTDGRQLARNATYLER